MPKKFITKKQEKAILQEDMSQNIKTILEYASDIAKRQPKIDQMAEDMGVMKDDIAVLKAGHGMMNQDIQEMKKDISEIKSDVKSAKDDLKQKADKKYVEVLTGLHRN